jgi:hypothetical protein
VIRETTHPGGNVTHYGNVVTTARDAAGRPLSVTMPSYTPPHGPGTTPGAQALTADNPGHRD